MTKYFYRREKLKRKNNEEEGKEEICFDEIKSQYLKRVSHTGIYDLHD